MVAEHGPIKPDQFSDLGMYGDREVFKKRLEDGYTEFAFGASNEIVEGYRLVAVWVFFRPDGRVATLETLKDYTGSSTERGRSEREYDEKDFEKMIEKYGAGMTERNDLKILLDRWAE